MSTKKLKEDPRASPQGAALFWIHRVDQACRQRILNQFRRRGHPLSAAQWEIMSLLWRGDGVNQSMLADATGTDKASITRILDRMVSEALVERQPDPEDRRAFRIYLTKSGKELHQQLLPVMQEIIQLAFAGIDQDKQKALSDVLRSVFKNLDASDQGIDAS